MVTVVKIVLVGFLAASARMTGTDMSHGTRRRENSRPTQSLA
jgi:hypothetical protein